MPPRFWGRFTRRWLGLTATPYRRDKLDDLICLQVGPVRHTLTQGPGYADADSTLPDLAADDRPLRPRPILHVHDTCFRYAGETDPSAPGGMAAVYSEMVADQARTNQVIADVVAAATVGRHCLVLTHRVAHVEALAAALSEKRLDPVVLRGGMGVKARAAALQRLAPIPGGPTLLVVAIGSYVGEGFDCPALDTLFLVAPIAFKGRLVQYAGRILRPYPGKTTAEVHDYHDVATGVLASSLAKRAADTPASVSQTPAAADSENLGGGSRANTGTRPSDVQGQPSSCDDLALLLDDVGSPECTTHRRA